MTGDLTSSAEDPAEALQAVTAELRVARADLDMLRRQLEDRDQLTRARIERQSMIEGELQHRARNTMALLRSIFRRTVEAAESLEHVELHFGDRLGVLARYQLPRSEDGRGTTDLENLIRNELHGFQFGDAPGITIEGPSVGIAPGHVQAFALAIHELVTNSLKFGALAGRATKLDISWSVADRQLSLLWQETGVSMVFATPLHKGFGREFLEEALPYQIGAVTAFDPQPGGVHWKIELPLM